MAQAKYSIGSRLQDPHGILKQESALLAELQEKITSCMTRLYRQPASGGNPFLFAITSPKSHEIADDSKESVHPITTAATDGRKYYWSAKFLQKLNTDEVATVMEHEGWHTAFFHPQRGKVHDDHEVWNWSVDYVVNSVIEYEKEKNNQKGQLWGGNIGKPWPFQELLDWLDGKVELVEGELRIFADKSLYGKAPELIYDEIMKHKNSSPRLCKKCGALNIDPKTKKPNPPGPCQNHPNCEHDGACCPVCGAKPNPCGGHSTKGLGSLDDHIPNAADKQEVMGDLARAKQQVAHMRGNVPGAVDDILGELHKPTIPFTDLIRSACMHKTQEAGLHNNWKKLRRRFLPGVRPASLSGGFRGEYLPTRHTFKPRWLAFLDVSGSMSQNDMAYGISQLQSLGNTEGFLCQVDAAIDWDNILKINNATPDQLKKIQVKGRGGTEFSQVLKEYRQKVGNEWDVMIFLTDGDCGTYPIELKPSCDVVWVLTRDNPGFKQPFGRVCPLRVNRM